MTIELRHDERVLYHLHLDVEVDPSAPDPAADQAALVEALNAETTTVLVAVGKDPHAAWTWSGPARATTIRRPDGTTVLGATRSARQLLSGMGVYGGDDDTALGLPPGWYPVRWRLVGITPEQPAGDGPDITSRPAPTT